ncbi:MAG: L-threonylcarbamoyladenylate synthase, partial [Paracoccaceae bacterium]
MQTRHLTDTPQGLEIAAQVLRNGGRVAFPTETVYGLGADAGNATAVAGIYAAKGRPSFNPLIVHVPDIAQARELVRWSDTAEALAQAHWPGALTLVLPLRKGAPISRLVTAGLDSLAIRIPAADLARRLLRAAGVPVAAPSANLSGQISPTRASHVAWGTEALPTSTSPHRGLDGRIEAILDGGPCPVGVESTIVSLTGTPQVLRPGGIPQETIAATLRTDFGMDLDVNLGGDQPSTSSAVITAPGQLASHYAPQAPLRLNAESFLPNEARLGFGKVACDLNLSP